MENPKMNPLKICFIFFVICLICQQGAEAEDKIQSSVFGNGGVAMGNGGYQLNGTVGQPVIGASGSSSNIVYAGFWYTVETIPGQLPQISVTPASITFSAILGQPDPGSKQLSITNTGFGMLSWTVSGDADWLILSPTSGSSVGETDEVSVSVNTASLSAGTHNATINVSADAASNSPQTVSVTLTAFPGDTFQYNMDTPGWYLISLPVHPTSPEIQDVLMSLGDSYDSVWTYDTSAGWKVYMPDALDASDLAEVESGRGYWIKINSSCSLIVVKGGQPITEIPISVGQNLVGYGSMDNRDIAECMSSIESKYISVWKYDPVEGWKYHAPTVPVEGGLDEMEPGSGYIIEATAAGTWNINAGY
jgi:hypothetical protein